MIVKSTKFIDTQFHSLVDRVEGELELIQVSPNYELLSVNITADSYRFYGVVFFKWIEEKKSGG